MTSPACQTSISKPLPPPPIKRTPTPPEPRPTTRSFIIPSSVPFISPVGGAPLATGEFLFNVYLFLAFYFDWILELALIYLLSYASIYVAVVRPVVYVAMEKRHPKVGRLWLVLQDSFFSVSFGYVVLFVARYLPRRGYLWWHGYLYPYSLLSTDFFLCLFIVWLCLCILSFRSLREEDEIQKREKAT